MKKYIITIVILIAVLLGLSILFKSLANNQELNDKLLADYGLNGLTVEAIIEKLENDEFPEEVSASIYNDRLVLTIGEDKLLYSLDEDLYYLSFAPYINYTHECFYHSLTGCRGELIDQDIFIRIYDEDNLLVNETTLNTGDDGFIGLFLESGINYRIEVETEELTSVFYANSSAGQTCFTEVILT